MIKYQLLSNQLGSASLKRLAVGLSKAVGYKVLRTRKPNPKRKQLAYGGVVDKITQYKYYKDKSIPSLEFTQSKQDAAQWIADGEVVVCRLLTRASCGNGIVIAETVDQLSLIHI